MKKLAIIGCGGIGKYHLKHFLQFDDIELAGFCDIIPERAESFVEMAKSGKAFACFKEMYDETQPDMVFICVPPAQHGEIEFETIRRKIHFFVEKPVALNMDLAREIRDKAAAAGLIAASGFQVRYSNLSEPMKAFIAENEIIYIRCDRMGGIPDTPWWNKRSESGGQIVEQTIHQLDYIRFVFGEPDTVFTMGTKGFVTESEGYDTEDLTTTVVKFKSGTLAAISTGCYAKGGAASDNSLVFGSKDSRAEIYILDKLNIYTDKPVKESAYSDLVVEGDGALDRSNIGVLTFKEEGDAGVACDRTFIDAVISGDASKILSPYADAVRSVSFTLACNQSMDTGLPVKIELD